MQHNLALLLVSTCLLGLSGCVTEVTGGLPAPASQEERVQAQLSLARGYIEQREFTRARIPLQKALKADPNHVEALVLNGLLLGAENEYELAEKHYLRALKIEPRHAQALNNYGSFLYARGRYQEAADVLKRLVKDTGYRARAQAFENLGFAQLQVGDDLAAGAAFKRAIELNFRQPRSSLELAHLALKEGDLKNAESHLTTFKAYSKPNARSLCFEVQLANLTNNKDQAASASLALRNFYPEQAGSCQAKI